MFAQDHRDDGVVGIGRLFHRRADKLTIAATATAAPAAPAGRHRRPFRQTTPMPRSRAQAKTAAETPTTA